MEKCVLSRALLLAAISCLLLKTAAGSCDYDQRVANTKFKGTMHRLGKTRYFIHFSNKSVERTGDVGFYTHTFFDWVGKCKEFYPGSRVAVFLDTISTNALIARLLEHTIVKKNITYYTYWIGATPRTDFTHADFHWYLGSFGGLENRNRALRFSNIFYKAPRVIGSANHVNKFADESKEIAVDGVHDEEDEKIRRLCMAFALPFQNAPNYGWQTSWVQKNCQNAASAICELPLSECDENINLNPHVLTEDKEYYYTDGNWIFSNRRFIVNWKPRNAYEARQYCSDYNLEVFTPTLDDLCLIPYLKMWGIVLNTYHFWTSYNYDLNQRHFMTQDGKILQKGAKVTHKYMSGRFQRANPPVVNVSYVWTYERKNETRCKEINCKWSYYMLAPIYAGMYLGTICQHKELDNSRACNFETSWNQDFTQGLAPTAIIEFGYKGSSLWRSAYKQTFANHLCDGDDRQLAGIETDYWNVKPEDVEYIYDYLETYWVVDEGGFTHEGKHEPLCTVSNLTIEGNEFKRGVYKVNCDEWHFYLCEYIF